MTVRQLRRFDLRFTDAVKKMEALLIAEKEKQLEPVLLNKLKTKQVIWSFKRVLRICPKQYQSLFYLGKFYQKQKKYKKALFYFEELISSGRTSDHILQEASLMAMRLNQVEKAVSYSKQALRKKPADFIPLGNRSLNLLIAGFDFEASATIHKAIELKPDNIFNTRVKAKIECVIAGQNMRPTFESLNSFTKRTKLPGLYYPGLLEYFQ